MKTLEQIANAAGVTKAAIYKRFQSYGLSVNQLKAEKQGKSKVYSDDIEQLIILMFKPDGIVENSVDTSGNTSNAEIKELQGLAEKLEVEKKAAEEGKQAAVDRAEKAEARAERAEAQIDKLLEQVDKLTDAIRAAEVMQAALSQANPALPKPEKQGLFKRLRAAFNGGKQSNEG